jgi:hypothetical protein
MDDSRQERHQTPAIFKLTIVSAPDFVWKNDALFSFSIHICSFSCHGSNNPGHTALAV